MPHYEPGDILEYWSESEHHSWNGFTFSFTRMDMNIVCGTCEENSVTLAQGFRQGGEVRFREGSVRLVGPQLTQQEKTCKKIKALWNNSNYVKKFPKQAYDYKEGTEYNHASTNLSIQDGIEERPSLTERLRARLYQNETPLTEWPFTISTSTYTSNPQLGELTRTNMDRTINTLIQEDGQSMSVYPTSRQQAQYLRDIEADPRRFELATVYPSNLLRGILGNSGI